MRTVGIMAVLMLLLSASASACDCVVTPSVNVAYTQAATVVSAEAVSVSREPGYVNEGAFRTRVEVERVEWEIKDIWKGSFTKGQHFETRTNVTCCMCGRSVPVGALLLLYLNNSNSVSTCGRTSELSNASADIPVLTRLASGT